MFLGEYNTKFTGHGRVVLPKKFREGLLGKKELILSRGLDGCIWGFSVSEFEKEAQKQLDIPVTEQRARDLRRYLFSGAESVSLDDQGRFVISKALLKYAKIEHEVAIIGAGDHFEVWNPLFWQQTLTRLMQR